MAIARSLAMWRGACVVVLVGLAAAAPVPLQAGDPFAFFQPTVLVTADDIARLDSGGTIARTLPARGNSIAVFAAVATNIRGDRLAAWIHNITAFKQGPQVLEIGRFSDPPVLEDLAGLTFPESDLDDVRECKVGNCGLKLSRHEITELSRTRAVDASSPALQHTLRRLVLERVRTYLAHGQGALDPYDDGSTTVTTAAASSRVMAESLFLTQRLPQFSSLVEQWPRTNGLAVEPTPSFVYWAKEAYSGKPVVSATHVFVRRATDTDNGVPETLVIGKQIFATHYIDAWIGVTALVRHPQNGRSYLVYVHRSSIDMLKGFWGGLIRHILQRRLKAEAPAVLNGIRRRLESGPPPAVTSIHLDRSARSAR